MLSVTGSRVGLVAPTIAAMGVRVDIFAATKVELARIDPFHGPAASAWPYVDCTDWVDGLDRLAADLTGREIEEFGEHELVFPERDCGDQDGGDWEGPWLVRVPSDVVDAMAFVEDAQIDQVEGLTEDESERNFALRDLCADALAQERDVYQWSTA